MLVWLDNWLSRAAAPQRELRARADGALHAGRRQRLHPDRRHAGGPRADRLDDPELLQERQLQRRDLRRQPALPRRRHQDHPGADRSLERLRRDPDHPELEGRPGDQVRPLSRRQALDVLRLSESARLRSSTSSGRSTTSTGRSIREVVRAIFLSPEFYEAHTRRHLGPQPRRVRRRSVRMLEGTTDFSAAANALPGMGQPLFDPADAKGWAWGNLVDEHGHRLLPGLSGQRAGDQPWPVRDTASIPTPCWPGRTPRPPTRSWISWRIG